jgi:hypothetical protein
MTARGHRSQRVIVREAEAAGLEVIQYSHAFVAVDLGQDRILRVHWDITRDRIKDAVVARRGRPMAEDRVIRGGSAAVLAELRTARKG